MRSLRGYLRLLPGTIATIFIAVTVALFVLFPRVVNWLADLTGTMGKEGTVDFGQGLFHFLIVLVIDTVLVYLFIVRPVRAFRRAMNSQGLVVRQGKGIGYIDAESVRQQVHAAITRVPEIARATVRIENQTGKAKVELNIWTIGNITGSKKKEEIRAELKKVLEQQLGVRLASEPIINMELIPAAPIVAPATPLDTRNELPATIRPRSDLEIELPSKFESPKTETSRTETTQTDAVKTTTAPNAMPGNAVDSAKDADTPIIGRRSLFASVTGALTGEKLDKPAATTADTHSPEPEAEVHTSTAESLNKTGNNNS